jgi:lantibiotic modifying enzyme
MLILKIINDISDEIVINRENITKDLDMGLFSGDAGVALFLFHLHDYTKKEEHKKAAQFYLEKSFEKINTGYALPTFCNGIAGIAWTVNYLVLHSFIEPENLDVLDDLDDYLHNYMVNYERESNFDFLHGATGIALYFINRINQNPKAADYLKEYVDALKEYSIFDAETNTAKIVSTIQDKDKNLKKVYNLGMAHGMSSIIAVLAKIYETDKTNLNLKYLTEGFSNYIMLHENINKYDNGAMFKTTVELDQDQNDSQTAGSRLGWCYGDMGNGFALYHAYEATGNEKYYEKSLEIFINSAKRKDLEKQRILDACVCHGSAGIIDIFKTVYEYFGDEELLEAENNWAELTLDFYTNAEGLKGFSKYTVDGPKYLHSFLEGTAGIGLALLFHHTGNKSEWNEFLLSR